MGPFDLGGWYRPIALLCVVGCVILIYIGIQPPNDKSLQILIGAFVLLTLVWFTAEKRRFQGPPIGKRIEDLKNEIAQSEIEVELPE